MANWHFRKCFTWTGWTIWQLCHNGLGTTTPLQQQQLAALPISGWCIDLITGLPVGEECSRWSCTDLKIHHSPLEVTLVDIPYLKWPCRNERWKVCSVLRFLDSSCNRLAINTQLGLEIINNSRPAKWPFSGNILEFLTGLHVQNSTIEEYQWCLQHSVSSLLVDSIK